MRRGALVAAAAVLMTGCSFSPSGSEVAPVVDPGAESSSPAPQGSESSTPSPEPTPAPVRVVAVGDIACDPTSPYFSGVPGFCQQEQVAKVVDDLVAEGAQYFLPLGDIQYETGSYRAYQQVYDPLFGHLKKITEPVAGNHEWYTDQAAGYFRYFGQRAGTVEQPWRSFSPVDGWQVLLLDSNCEYLGGCGPSSPQGRWITRTLAASDAPCVMATFHHPLRTSGEYFGITDTTDRAAQLWQTLAPGGVDVVLNGHDHLYERFAPFRGIRQFTVGTGGKNPNDQVTKAEGSQRVISGTYGALELTLFEGGYRYAFHAIDGRVLDNGVGSCDNESAR